MSAHLTPSVRLSVLYYTGIRRSPVNAGRPGPIQSKLTRVVIYVDTSAVSVGHQCRSVTAVCRQKRLAIMCTVFETASPFTAYE